MVRDVQTNLEFENLKKDFSSSSNTFKGTTDIKYYKPKKEFSRKQKNAYNTIITGLKTAGKLGKRVRFLTLTTSDIQALNVEYDDKKLNESFRKLKQQIKRMTISKLVKLGYLQHSDIRRYYPSKSLNATFDFDYFKVVTNEGNGVIHCVYKGEYLPYNYIVDSWNDIHNSWDVNIKLIGNKTNDNIKASRYIVSQYVSGQTSAYQRSSQSWGWIFRGYRKAWKQFLAGCRMKYFYNPVRRRFYFKREVVNIFDLWDKMVMSIVKPVVFLMQQVLFPVPEAVYEFDSRRKKNAVVNYL